MPGNEHQTWNKIKKNDNKRNIRIFMTDFKSGSNCPTVDGTEYFFFYDNVIKWLFIVLFIFEACTDLAQSLTLRIFYYFRHSSGINSMSTVY